MLQLPLILAAVFFGFHVSGNLLAAAVPLVPMLVALYGFGFAFAALVLRSLLSQMDVPTRSSYVMAIVESAERPAAASVTASHYALDSHAVRKRSLFQGGRWEGPEGVAVAIEPDEAARLGAEGPGGQSPSRFAPFRVIRGGFIFCLSQADNQEGACTTKAPRTA